MAAGATSMHYCVQTRQLFVGLENGTINVCIEVAFSKEEIMLSLSIFITLQEFILEHDYNQMTAMREYAAHQTRVTGVIFAPNCEWVLSIGRDKVFQLHCSETGQKLGSYQTDAWYTALQYPFYKK